MSKQKQIQSKIYVLKARLKQIQTSELFSDAERKPLEIKLTNKLNDLEKQLEEYKKEI